MAAMSASTMAVLGSPQVAVVKASSSSSVSFGNGGLPSMAFVRARPVGPLTLHATAGDKAETPSSTGGISEKAREMAEKTAVVFDGVKEDVESTLKDGGRDLKSKTGDVVYGAQRNAADVGSDVTEKAKEAQTKFTKGDK